MTIRNKPSASKRGSKKTMKAGTKTRHHRRATGKQNYRTYVHKVLANNVQGFTISSKAMRIVNSYVNDNFERLAGEASRLVSRSKQSTISVREIQSAARLILPKGLADHSQAHGLKALNQYANSS